MTDDPDAAEVARHMRHLVVGDEPDAGLNPALVHGAAMALERWPGARVAALSSDLPALRPDELGLALVAAKGHPRAFVADAGGTGTNLLTATALGDFVPRFGRQSAQAHQADGAVELSHLALPSLRRDVDTEADLSDAQELGLGIESAALVARLPRERSILQATVRTHDGESRTGTVLLDDGVELPYAATALDAGGLRFVRPGQRLWVEIAVSGREVTAMSIERT